ncbi:MAG: hypothetical protein US94_C0001G0040 [Berkelbacteria bacterium GW2011_GWB1_38_5]|uniref:Uncharacterized protein n=2 Tax=Candidatus Berkelbacteria TaxID=1618330 RepID=A0A0G0LIP6_9BACT|nr:MAG: hypothetical protein US94_C0001G0040 [Berkelbacteria bacterium GW2011_GWB1_38_5]KKQ90942.1 MAG: hypothetical protein UT15_C0002G0015 [Berkelbacteria bacterium GW2011_GWA1_39_10]
MILRLYLFSLYFILFISAGLVALILFNVNPYQSPFWMLLIFYFTLFLFWTAVFGLIGFYLRIWMTNREVIFAHLIPTLRQSLLISLVFVGLLFLQQMRVLNWWVASLLVVAILMIELFFKSKNYSPKKGYR